MSISFKALIPFSHDTRVFNPDGTIYEHENDSLVNAWSYHNYCKIVEKQQGSLVVEKESVVESVENGSGDVIDSLSSLTYKELQTRAKEAGLNPIGVKKDVLIEQLKEVE